MISRILDELEATHLHVIGASGYGKSKFLQALLEEAFFRQTGFCVIDWKGELYRSMLEWLAVFGSSSRPVYLLDLSESEYVVPYNPFTPGSDLSARVSNWINFMMKVWGATDTDETPRLSRVLRCLFWLAASQNETLQNAALSLNPDRVFLRDYAIQAVPDEYIREQWRALHGESASRFRLETESTVNRLDRLLGEFNGFRRMIGRSDATIDISRIVAEGAILLVNLNSGHATAQAGRTLAALLLADITSAVSRFSLNPVAPFYVCMDEFQEYVTHDVATMLDLARQAGLRLILCNQRLGQLMRDENLDDAVAVEAQIKVVFGGLQYEHAAELARDFFPRKINEREIKETYYRTVAKHHLTEVWNRSFSSSRTHSDGSSRSEGHRMDDDEHAYETESWSEATSRGESAGWNQQSILMPEYEAEVTHDAEWTPEEKVSRAAQRFQELRQRECFVKLPGREARRYFVRKVEPLYLSPTLLRDFQIRAYERQQALPVAAHDQHMAKSRETFLHRATEVLKEAKNPPRTKATNKPRI